MSKAYKNIVVLTGAGISADSGLKTFRDNDGLWENHRVEEVATPEAFQRNPELVYRFYNLRREQLKEAKPNPAHFTLAELATQENINLTLVTQNVDDLHEKAGSKNSIHMHGELNKVRCISSNKIYDWREELSAEHKCQCCKPPSRLRPHIVWFGEMPLYMEEIFQALEQCDLFLSIGTSGHVYPAAGFVEVAHKSGAHCVELNLEKSLQANHFHEHHNGRAAEIVPQFIKSLTTNS